MFEDAVGHVQEFAHHGGDDDHFVFATGPQARRKCRERPFTSICETAFGLRARQHAPEVVAEKL